MQRRKYEVGVRRPLPGFADTVVLEDPTSGNVSTAAELVGPVQLSHLDALRYYDRVVLVLGKHAITPDDVLKAFKYLVGSTSANRFFGMAQIALKQEWIVLRIYEDSCTYCVAEFFGSDVNINLIIEILGHLEIPRISQDEVVAFLREGSAL